jgi:thiol-disulfide isomerase/thioredoxin
MYIPFEQMPDHARVWIYQADRPLTLSDCQTIAQTLEKGTQSWEAHGAPLQASFEIRFNQVVVVAVNESVNQASGCSIDASTRWFKELATDLRIDFFNRDLAIVRGESLELIPISQIKTQVQAGNINPNDTILTPLTDLVAKYRNAWLCPASASYIQRHF